MLWLRQDAMTETSLWWVEQENRIKQLEAKYQLLLDEYNRLSEMMDTMVGRVHHLELDG